MGQPLELERAPTDLVNLVTQAVTEVQETTDRHRIELETIPTLVGEWDAARLERVVRNLLENAVKYSVDDDVIELRLAREDDGESAAVLTVHDHGIGIPPEDLPRIFDRFQRGSNVVGKIAGTGIGLAGARQIVEQHGGTITVSSEVRRGTTVTVRLPLTPRAQQTAGVPENASIN
jgi:signal transduction histidine kinase